VIQRSDQKLWPFRKGTLVSSDGTSASPSSDSTSTPRKTAFRNSSKILRVIQLSDQKLWPFRIGSQVRSDETSAAPSSDLTSTPRKTASGNSCKNLREIHRSDQKLYPYRTSTLVWSDDTSAAPSSGSTSTPRKTADELVLWSAASTPPPHQVAIPKVLLGKHHPKTPVKIWGRSNGRIKSYGPFIPVF
jgi:hypothetical protein